MRVSVVFASPSTRNAGMAAVDHAWEAVREKIFPRDSVKKYRFDCVSFDGGEYSGYCCLTEHFDEFISADLIVYWGDFLHMRHYHVRKAKQLVSKQVFPDFTGALEFVQKCLVLKDASDSVLKKTISFGTNQLLESTSELVADAVHCSAFQTFVKGIRAYYPRDFYSNQMGSFLRGHMNQLGCDAALGVWERSDVRPLPKNPRIGVYFGRSRSGLVGQMVFCIAFSRMLSGQLEWIEWIDKQERYDRLVRWFFCRLTAGRVSDLSDNGFRRVKDYDLLITDTYHLAVNGWAAGVPSICIGRVVDRLRGSGAKFAWNDKRFMFYQMMFGHEFFVHSSECMSIRKLRARQQHLRRCLNDRELVKFVYEGLYFLKNQAFGSLHSELAKMRQEFLLGSAR